MNGLMNVLTKITGVSFASFVYTAKGTGEVAKIRVIIGASTENLYEKDVAKLERYVSLLKRIGALPHTILAAEELLASRKESLTKGIGNNDRYACKDTYTHLKNLPGIRIHNETGELYISALTHGKKEVIVPGTYKEVKSAPKTIAKKRIEKKLPSGRFRLYALGQVTTARVSGQTLELA